MREKAIIKKQLEERYRNPNVFKTPSSAEMAKGGLASNLLQNNRIAVDLLAELAASLSAKLTLKDQNGVLRAEVNQLKTQNEEMQSRMQLEKSKYEREILYLKDELCRNEAKMIRMSRKCLLKQKRYVDGVIRRLKTENAALKKNIGRMEREFKKKIKQMQSCENCLKKI